MICQVIFTFTQDPKKMIKLSPKGSYKLMAIKALRHCMFSSRNDSERSQVKIANLGLLIVDVDPGVTPSYCQSLSFPIKTV